MDLRSLAGVHTALSAEPDGSSFSLDVAGGRRLGSVTFGSPGLKHNLIHSSRMLAQASE